MVHDVVKIDHVKEISIEIKNTQTGILVITEDTILYQEPVTDKERSGTEHLGVLRKFDLRIKFHFLRGIPWI